MHGPRNFCARCGLAFGDKRKLFAHLVSQHAAADPIAECPKCGNFIKATYLGLEKHLARAHSGTVRPRYFACRDCPGRFETVSRLRVHGRLVHGPAIFHCDKCTAAFKSPGNLRLHMQRHSSTGQPHICHICSRICKSSVRLKAHVKTHSQSSKPFRCAVCLAAYTGRPFLRDHLIRHNNGAIVNSFRCDVCEFATYRKWRLAAHKKAFHSEIRFGCAHCAAGDLFPTRSTLMRHQLRQHGVRGAWLKYCNICQECFVDTTELHEHMPVHSEAQFRCCQCTRQSVDRTALAKHIRTMHQSEAGYCCAVCSRTFKWKNCLQQHMTLHQNESPYKCNVCSRAFKRICFLSQHQTVHDKIRKRYACARCQRSFLKKIELAKHIMPYLRKSHRKPDAEMTRKRPQTNAIKIRGCKAAI